MKRHQIQKQYVALVRGIPSPRRGVIERPIGRQGGDIKVRQWVDVPDAVPAVTRYEVINGNEQCAGSFSVIRAFPETGRLHQIRVHLAALGHPILGDPLYTDDGEAYRRMVRGDWTAKDRSALGFPRLALHAAALSFPHPRTRKPLRVVAPLPDDMRDRIKRLSKSAKLFLP